MKIFNIIQKTLYYYLTCKLRDKGKNNQVILEDTMIRSSVIRINGSNNIVIISKGAECIKNMTIIINGNNCRFVMGKDCKVNKAVFSMHGDGCVIEIGDETTFNVDLECITHEPGRQVIIGKDCMFSVNVRIQTSDEHSIIDLEKNERINYGKDIYIGNHVWIGGYARVMKGTYIEDNSVVGMNSLVTGKVLANTVVAGIPAKQVKAGVSWARENYYESDEFSR